MTEKPLYSFYLDQKPRLFLNWFLYKLFNYVQFDENAAKDLKLMQREGTVVYAIKYRSLLDYLLYHYRFRKRRTPYPRIGFHMNMSLVLPLSQLLRVIRFHVGYFLRQGRWPNPFETGILGDALQRGTVSLISLVDPKSFARQYVHAEKDALHFILETQQHMDRPIYIVPLLVLYKQAPEKESEGLADLFFSYKDKPGLIRKIGLFFRYHRQAFIDFGRPFDLKSYLETRAHDTSLEAVTEDVRQKLIEAIDAQKRVILGPIMKSRQQLKEKVLRDPGVTKILDTMERSKAGKPKQLRRKAGGHFDEIAADYNPAYAQFFHSALSRLWKRIFEGIDVDSPGLSVVREWARRGPVVFIPSHKSHIDYLVLNYVLYLHRMHIPRIAAGANLAFWPMGHIFRKSGAFFVRRSFGGAKLYTVIFETYIKVLLEEGYSLEFFIEGGRSRSGKLILPKMGFLSILLQAYYEQYCNDLIFVPVSISYDRILEEKSYLKELGGGEKEAESFTQMLKARRFLKRKYGKIYIRFAQPLSFRDYLTERPDEERNPESPLAFQMIRSINQVTLVTPFAVVASAILAKHRRGFTFAELEQSVETLLAFLKRRETPLAATLRHPEKSVQETLSLLINRKIAESLEGVIGTDSYYYVDEDKKPELEYYKNSIIHYFVRHAFVAVSLLTGTEEVKSRADLETDYGFMKDLFKYEFVFEEDSDRPAEIDDVAACFVEAAFIRPAGSNGFQLTPLGYDKLPLWAGLAKTFLESYWIAVTFHLQGKKQARKRPDLLKEMYQMGRRLHRQGLIDHREALSKLNFENAHQFIVRDVLRRRPAEERQTETRGDLKQLGRRLYELSHY